MNEKLLEVTVDDELILPMFDVRFGEAYSYHRTREQAETQLGRFIFLALEAGGKLDRPEPKEITVNYALLEKQLSALARSFAWSAQDRTMLDGVFELVEAIAIKKPFKEERK